MLGKLEEYLHYLPVDDQPAYKIDERVIEGISKFSKAGLLFMSCPLITFDYRLDLVSGTPLERFEACDAEWNSKTICLGILPSHKKDRDSFIYPLYHQGLVQDQSIRLMHLSHSYISLQDNEVYWTFKIYNLLGKKLWHLGSVERQHISRAVSFKLSERLRKLKLSDHSGGFCND